MKNFIFAIIALLFLSCNDTEYAPSENMLFQLTVDFPKSSSYHSDIACNLTEDNSFLNYSLLHHGTTNDTLRGVLPFSQQITLPILTSSDEVYSGNIWLLPNYINMKDLEINRYAYTKKETDIAAVTEVFLPNSNTYLYFDNAKASLLFLIPQSELRIFSDCGFDTNDISSELVLDDKVKSNTYKVNPNDTILYENNVYVKLFKADVIPFTEGLANAVLSIRFANNELNYNFNNLPVRRNETIIITDEFLTSNVQFDISINSEFDNQYIEF